MSNWGTAEWGLAWAVGLAFLGFLATVVRGLLKVERLDAEVKEVKLTVATFLDLREQDRIEILNAIGDLAKEMRAMTKIVYRALGDYDGSEDS